MNERQSTAVAPLPERSAAVAHGAYADTEASGRPSGAASGRGVPPARHEFSMLQVYTSERARESRLVIEARGAALPAAQNQFDRAQRIARGEMDAHDAEWLSKGFAAFLAGAGAVPLERCLRLPRNDSALRRASRNHWLCRAWETLATELSPWRRSEKLAAAVRDFKSRQWPRWRALEHAPSHATKLELALYNAFRAHERVPCTAMQLHNIASGLET